MKNRIIGLFLSFAMMFSIAAIGTISVSAEEVGDFEFQCLDDYTVQIVKYIGSDSKVEIPIDIIGKDVTEICDGAFYDCDTVTSVIIPYSVEYIDSNAFNGCNNLTSIEVSDENEYYSSENGILFTDDMESLLCYPQGKTENNYVIPDYVNFIGECAFSNCNSLENITIPDSVTYIGEFAFGCCEALNNVFIPDSVSYIEKYAFYECKNLSNVIIGSGVGTIGSCAFNNTALFCDESNWENGVLYIGEYLISGMLEIFDENNMEFNVLTEAKGELIIKNGTTIIADSAFDWCESLTGVTMPEGLINIGEYAFTHCTSLKKVNLSESVVNVFANAFFDCTSLENISVSEKNEEYSSENGVLFNKDKTELLRYPSGKTDKNYKIPDSVKEIREYAFHSCTSLTDITIPDKVTYISESAFSYCSSLTSASMPSSLKYISEHAFENCTALQELNLNKGLNYIENRAFYGCTSLKSVTIPASVSVIGEYAFGYYMDFEEWHESKVSDFKIYYNSNAAMQYAIENGFEYEKAKEGIVYGDANFDGEVDMLDVLLIRKYIAKQPIELDETVADVTCNGEVDMLDVLLIRKYIAKQPVTLGPKG